MRRNNKNATPKAPKEAAARAAPQSRLVMTSTQAQNSFGRIMDAIASGKTVDITSRNRRKAVVLAAEEYDRLTTQDQPDLDRLSAEFDAMVERMQTPSSRAAEDGLFAASGAELGQAALRAARGRR